MSFNLMIPLVVGLVVIFVIIALVLRLMLRGHIDLAMKRVQKLNEDNLRRELELKRKLDETDKDCQKKIAEGTKESGRLREEGQRQAQEIKEHILAEAERERKELLADAQNEIENMKQQVLNELEERTLNRSRELLKLVLTEQLTKEMHTHFTERVLEELSQDKRRLGIEHDYVEVISAQPLTDEQKHRLTQLLGEKTGKKIKLKETIDQERNIAGIYIKLGDVIIEGTLRQRLQQVLTQTKESRKT